MATQKKKTAKKPTSAKKKTAKKKATAKKPMAPMDEKRKARVYAMPFGAVYPLYVEKVTKKGRTKQELDEVIGWLTGYRGKDLQQAIEDKRSFESFFAQANMNANAHLVTGVVCGVRIEELDDPLMKKLRQLDKVVDELAQGRKLEKILRA